MDVQREGGVSTKGPRGGVFVMYNCARLHTLFDSYERGVEKGEEWCFARTNARTCTCRCKLLGSNTDIYTVIVPYCL